MEATEGLAWLLIIGVGGMVGAWIGVHLFVEWLFGGK